MRFDGARFPDWEERLRIYLDTRAERPFKWGEHDCAIYAAGAVEAMTGVNPASEFLGRYEDRDGAALALREVGAGTLLATVTDWFGDAIPIAFAQRGDLVMRGTAALGVSTGQWSYFVGEEGAQTGLVALPTYQLSRAWRVPY